MFLVGSDVVVTSLERKWLEMPGRKSRRFFQDDTFFYGSKNKNWY